MSERSNLFQNAERRFKDCGAEEITERTLDAVANMVEAMRDCDASDGTIISFLLYAAMIGVSCQDGELSEEEKALADETIGRATDMDQETLYTFLSAGADDEWEEVVRQLPSLGTGIAMPFLDIVLGFAYIDGEADDDVLDRLDGLMGTSLLAAFAQSGMEEVPEPSVTVAGLERDIMEWLEDGDKMAVLGPSQMPDAFPSISERFAGSTEEELQEALDGLCEKELVYKTESILGQDMYVRME